MLAAWQRWVVLLAVLLQLCACGSSSDLQFQASAWPAADALFRQGPRWLGAVGADSVPLGGDRVLWLLGDTFVATSPKHVRAESRKIRNTVAIQTGCDATSATNPSAWQLEWSTPSTLPSAIPRGVGLRPGWRPRRQRRVAAAGRPQRPPGALDAGRAGPGRPRPRPLEACALFYAAEGNPELVGAYLVVTYVANTMADFSALVNDNSLYDPHQAPGSQATSGRREAIDVVTPGRTVAGKPFDLGCFG